MNNAPTSISFRCFYHDSEPTNHRQTLPLSDIPRWIEAYQFTHPACTAISIKVWLGDDNQKGE